MSRCHTAVGLVSMLPALAAAALCANDDVTSGQLGVLESRRLEHCNRDGRRLHAAATFVRGDALPAVSSGFPGEEPSCTRTFEYCGHESGALLDTLVLKDGGGRRPAHRPPVARPRAASRHRRLPRHGSLQQRIPSSSFHSLVWRMGTARAAIPKHNDSCGVNRAVRLHDQASWAISDTIDAWRKRDARRRGCQSDELATAVASGGHGSGQWWPREFHLVGVPSRGRAELSGKSGTEMLARGLRRRRGR